MVQGYRRIELGSTEELFLDLIAAKERSTWDIYSELDISGSRRHKGKRGQYQQPQKKPNKASYSSQNQNNKNEMPISMAYKNVHLRVAKLHKLGLVEKIRKKLGEKSIRYRITSQGLFQCLLVQNGLASSEILFLYKDNIILQTILYQFFETETVRELISIFGEHVFDNYLEKCCENTLTVIQNIKLDPKDIDEALEKMWPYYYPNKLEGRRIVELDQLLHNEAYRLIYAIVQCAAFDPNYEDSFPNEVISTDKKFQKLLGVMKMFFDEGYKNLVARCTDPKVNA